MPLVIASGKAEEKRAALNQSSLGSTATGTPHSRDAREILTPSKEDFEDDVKVLRQPLGPSPGNFRRRRYVELTQQLMLQNVVLDREIKDHEVVIAGPLQQRFWGFLWRWRWCVLKGTSLFVYRDEASWPSSSKGFECYDVSDMIAVNENVHTGLPFFRCLHHATNCNIAAFRAGEADVWEEVACMHLWVDLINIAQTCESREF
mmetsp:Transcript_59876/g.121558  ORF Transcript_59876/g.121558 Transcript_59876/m.121558 type:complete len:204 (-) Transcript_59876:96-707(-)